jgi:hypothetical protein
LTLEPPPTLGKESEEEEKVLDGTEESNSAKDLSGVEEELRKVHEFDDARGGERGRGAWCMEEEPSGTKGCGKEER